MIPNLLTASASYVVLDVKGELLDGYGNYLKEKGYRIKALNLKIMERSNQYNPFSYIRTEEDIIKLVTNLQVNTTPPDSMKGDPFWEDGLALYLMSLFLLCMDGMHRGGAYHEQSAGAVQQRSGGAG